MRSLIVLILLALTVPMFAGRDVADRYVREAEYYQKKADGYRREAAYYFRKAEQYERDSAYYKAYTLKPRNIQQFYAQYQ